MSDTDYQRWICEACGFIYDEAQGDPDSGLAPGTRYADIPDDWECPLCGMRKSDLRLLSDTPAVAQAPVRRMASRTGTTCRGGDDYLVIIGAGIAGWSVAEQVRRHLPDRNILMVTACSGAAYSKPALSNALSRHLQADDLILQSGEQRAAELDIALRAETRVIKVDPARRRIVTSKGAIHYGQLVLALGGAQRDLNLQGDAASDVLAINDLRGYRKLRQHIEAGATRVTILGAGLIGCEFAEDLAGAGIQVDVVDPASRPISRLLSSPLAGLLESRLAEKGVRWHLQQTVDRVDHAGGGLRVTLASGDAFDTDLVMSAAGLAPSTGLAERMGLDIDQGILTDSDMRTSDPAVFALGDCAAVQGRIYNHVESIQQQARAIAGALAGVPAPFSIVSPLVRIKTPSLPLAVCQPVCAGDSADYRIQPSADGLRVEYLHDGKLVGFVLAEDDAAEAAELYQQVQQRVAC